MGNAPALGRACCHCHGLLTLLMKPPISSGKVEARHAAEKNGRKSASEKIGCIQLQGLRNVRGSKRFGFFLCLGYGAMAYLGQETG